VNGLLAISELRCTTHPDYVPQIHGRCSHCSHFVNTLYRCSCPTDTVQMFLSNWHCTDVPVQLTLYRCCCPTDTVQMFLSNWHCTDVAVQLTLYRCSCPTDTVQMFLSNWHCTDVAVQLTLYRCCCPTDTVQMLLSNWHCTDVPVQLTLYCTDSNCRYCHQVTNWTTRGSMLGRSKSFFYSQNPPHWLRGPLSLLIHRYRVSSAGLISRAWSWPLTSILLPTLRMSGAKRLRPL